MEWWQHGVLSRPSVAAGLSSALPPLSVLTSESVLVSSFSLIKGSYLVKTWKTVIS
jgi:hypothetical protein